MSAVLLAALLVGAVPPVHLRLEVAGGIACPTVHELERALLPRFETVSRARDARALAVLRISPGKSRGSLKVELSMDPKSPPLGREVPVGGASCAAAAETVALMADAWTRALPWRVRGGVDAGVTAVSRGAEEAAAERGRQKNAQPRGDAGAGADVSRGVEEAAELGSQNISQPRRDAGADASRLQKNVQPGEDAGAGAPRGAEEAADRGLPKDAQPRGNAGAAAYSGADSHGDAIAREARGPDGSAERGRERAEPASAALGPAEVSQEGPGDARISTEPPPPSTPRPWSLELLGGASISVDRSARPSPLGEIALDVTLWDRWGIGARAGFSAPTDLTLSPGTPTANGEGVSVLRAPFTLFARWSLHDPGESGFSLRAGLLAEILSGKSRGFDHTGTATVPSPGAMASARFEWRAGARIGLFFEAGLVFLPIKDTFAIGGLGDVAAAPRVLGRGAAGLAIHF